MRWTSSGPSPHRAPPTRGADRPAADVVRSHRHALRVARSCPTCTPSSSASRRRSPRAHRPPADRRGQPSSTTRRGTFGTRGERAAAARGVTTTAVAPESVTIQPASSALKWMLTGTTIAPSRPHACVATKNSAEFGTSTATRSPRRTPQLVQRMGQVAGRSVELREGHTSARPRSTRRRVRPYPGLRDHSRFGGVHRPHLARHRLPARRRHVPRTRAQIRNRIPRMENVDCGHWRTGRWPIGTRPTPPRSGRCSTPRSSSCNATTPIDPKVADIVRESGLSQPGLLPPLRRQGRAAARAARRRPRATRPHHRAAHGRGRPTATRAIRAWVGAVARSGARPVGRRGDPAVRRQQRAARGRVSRRGRALAGPARRAARGTRRRRANAAAVYHLAMGAVHDALAARQRPDRTRESTRIDRTSRSGGAPMSDADPARRECLLTGIGGQGVQLCAQVLARGAALEGKHVMLFGVYGGTMRGMNTDATVVDRRRAAALSAAGLAHRVRRSRCTTSSGARSRAKLRDGALVLVNDATFETPLDADRYRVVRVPATDRATELGNALGGSMVMAGAYAAISGLVGARRARSTGCASRSRRTARSTSRPTTTTLARPASQWGSHAARRRRSRCVSANGTVTIDVEVCKGCELCIPACPPRVLAMSDAVNHLGYHYPELHRGCTGCAACLLVCPDFVFEVFRATARDAKRPWATDRREAHGGVRGDRARRRSRRAAGSSPATR